MTNSGGIARRFGVAIVVLSVAVSTAGCLTDFTGPGTNDNVPQECGNGVLEGGELCDGADFGGQTCETALGMEFGQIQCTDDCLLNLSECNDCGNGIGDANEACDDFNHSSDDGCSELCQIEEGWTCMGEPSLCSTLCGDGIIAGVEDCDDGNTSSGDGCTAGCTVDPGWVCDGEPSDCNETCGNGVLDPAEGCDDGNLIPTDGCSPNCAEESGWQCSGEPSVCTGVCGDGLVLGGEVCDDGNTVDGDGCLADCTVEVGWTCDYTAEPPAGCTPICGDGLLLGDEACDDGNAGSFDGCGPDCAIEPFSACEGVPSVCICVVYVDRNVSSAVHSGADWASAFEEMPGALQAADWRSPCEVWVAEGTYYTYRFSETDRLEPRDNVSLYGGFAGDETWRSQRDFASRTTVLSGEQENNTTNRVRRILDISGAQGVTIDGFTVSGALNPTSEGGGARIQNGTNVVLRNCIFENNVADSGAAVYLRDSELRISDCGFANNSADQNGGAIAVDNNGILLVEGSLFSGNSANDSGGAIRADDADSLTVDRCRFIQNISQGYGGGVGLTGSVVASIVNSVFWQNSAAQGGGGINVFQTGPPALVTNCTFHDNTAAGLGASVRAFGGDLDARNTIFWGSATDQIYDTMGGTVTLSYCDVFGGASGNGVFEGDPDFVAPATGDLRLLATSPCIDAADGDVAPTTDLNGDPRVDVAIVANGNVGTPGYVDIGAFEYQP